MKFITITLLAFPVFLLQNCGEKDNSVTLVSTNIIEVQKDFLYGDSPELQFEMLDTINLSAPGNPPITVVQDISFSDHFFLLLDRKQGILKFDYTGKYIEAIGEKGEGPKEYSMPYAIHLDEEENSVLVADWQKRIVISYDLEGIFNSSSQRLPGHPISFYKENDTLLVVQETLNGTKEKLRQVLVSSIAPKTLKFKDWQSPLYGYDSRLTIIQSFPRILSRVKNESLFYFPIIRENISSQTKTDTIFRKQEDHLVPEYLLRFTGFEDKNQLHIGQLVLSDDYIFSRIIYDHSSHFIVIDLKKNHPIAHLKQLFDRNLTEENIPRPLKGDMYYSILRNEDGVEERNPLIVFYRLVN
jgi:hypothetical protein